MNMAVNLSIEGIVDMFDRQESILEAHFYVAPKVLDYLGLDPDREEFLQEMNQYKLCFEMNLDETDRSRHIEKGRKAYLKITGEEGNYQADIDISHIPIYDPSNDRPVILGFSPTELDAVASDWSVD